MTETIVHTETAVTTENGKVGIVPGVWRQRDPETGQIWNEYTQAEMLALLRTCNPDSPDYLRRPQGASRLFRVDYRTVGVRIVGRDTDDVPFYWEFDLYEGWAEQGRTEPAPLALTEPAHREGMSVLDFLAAPGSVTATARRMVAAERARALQVATPLLETFVELLNPEEDGTPRTSREWYNARVEPIRALLLEVLARLTRGSAGRAAELLAHAVSEVMPLCDALDVLRERWNLDEYRNRFPASA